MLREALHFAGGAAFVLWVLGAIGLVLNGQGWVLLDPVGLVTSYLIFFVPLFLWGLWSNRPRR